MIKRLILNNITIEIRGLGISGQTITKKVDHLEVDNIDSTKGFPTEQLVKKVFGGSGILQYIQNAFSPEKALEDLVDPFKIFGKQERAPESQSP